MDSWFINSIFAMLAFGGMQALLKLPAAKGYDKSVYSSLGFIVAASLSFVFFRNDISLDVSTIFYGFVWGSINTVYFLLQMTILKKLDTSTSFPITSLGSHVLVVMIGVFIFGDILSLPQTLALVGTFLLIGFYNHSKKHITLSNGLIPITLGIIVSSTLIKFIQKIGSASSVAGNYIFWQLLFAAVASVVVLFFVQDNSSTKRRADGKLFLWSACVGALTLGGTVAMIKALTSGPFSLVYTINTFYILVSSVIAWKLFDEKLTRHKIIFILLAIGTLLIIRFG